MKKLFLNVLAILLVTTGVQAQLQTPAPSPSAEVKQTVGLTEVTINYSRPGVKGRTIFAENGLVPYGQVWRTGANAATKISFSEDVVLGGKELEAGSYAVLTKPHADKWEFMLYPYEASNFGSYLEKEPTATFSAPTTTLPGGLKVESFAIGLDGLRNNSAYIYFSWDNTWVQVPLEVHTTKQVMASFERLKAGPSAAQYYAIGNFMYDQGEDLETALKYVQKATHGENPGFWQVHTEAKILADLGKKTEAVMRAKKSMEMAKKAGNQDYVRLNEKLIAKVQ
ncbi:MAG: DUF2911 domain-containing protein [Saprospiraceae bacterium]|nr:DUF2911 domain-containing protein [Saprospiraceae bacterium]